MQAQTEQLTLPEVCDRLDRLPLSRFHAKILIVAALSLLFDTLDTAVTGFVLASLRPIWHFDVKTIGIVSAIGLSGYLVGSFICGFVADRLGRKKTILFTMILYSIFSASRGLTNTVGVFAFFNFFTWFFVGAESSTVPPYLAELWPARIRGKLVGWMMAFFGAGIALSSVWSLLTIPTLGWRWALLLTAPFALTVGLMRWVLPESPRWLIRAGRPSDAQEILTRIEEAVAKSTGQVLPAVIPSRSGVQLSTRSANPKELIGAAYRRLTFMLWVVWFAEYGVLYTYQIFLPTILSAEGRSIVNSFRYSVVIYLSVVPGYVIGGYVVEWLDRKYTILVSFASVVVFGTLFAYSRSPVQIMVFAGLTVFFISVGSTAIYTYTPELHPTGDSRDRDGNRVCLGTSRRRNDAIGFRTLLCDLRQIIIVSDHQSRSHSCHNRCPLPWSINSWKAASRDVAQNGQRSTGRITGKQEVGSALVGAELQCPV